MMYVIGGAFVHPALALPAPEVCNSPQIVGGPPGSGFACCGSAGGAAEGSTTISRSVASLPLPFNFDSTGLQQSAQISYTLPSICRSKQGFVSPHMSQTIMSPSGAFNS